MPMFEEEGLPERGDPGKWVELNGEETRCLLGLQSYYTRIEDKSAQESLRIAWEDLKREFPRLAPYLWYK